MDEDQLIQFISDFEWTTEIGQAVHERLMELLKIYFFIGGMPGAIAQYQATESLQDCQNYLMSLITLYRADIAVHATKNTIPVSANSIRPSSGICWTSIQVLIY